MAQSHPCAVHARSRRSCRCWINSGALVFAAKRLREFFSFVRPFEKSLGERNIACEGGRGCIAVARILIQARQHLDAFSESRFVVRSHRRSPLLDRADFVPAAYPIRSANQRRRSSAVATPTTRPS